MLGIVVLFIVIGAIGSIGNDETDSKQPKPASTSTPRPTPTPEISLTAADLISAYEDNELAADNRYKDKIIVVTGVIEDFGEDFFDDAYVAITYDPTNMDDWSVLGINCHFIDSDFDKVTRLSKGDVITVRGYNKGDPGFTIVFEECTILTDNPDPTPTPVEPELPAMPITSTATASPLPTPTPIPDATSVASIISSMLDECSINPACRLEASSDELAEIFDRPGVWTLEEKEGVGSKRVFSALSDEIPMSVLWVDQGGIVFAEIIVNVNALGSATTLGRLSEVISAMVPTPWEFCLPCDIQSYWYNLHTNPPAREDPPSFVINGVAIQLAYVDHGPTVVATLWKLDK